ncbi:YybH family protein [Flavobacterium taihuense]|uniref:Nuclear transport factor 2 family protein n=1 Tax=Flavobacterium taihuense TaxID=2857508 RepID=A0ABS6XZE4_9FLAO|nr:nuclear transport factor 2 family protein [Flavobacterium taihuense]MBW4361188.1 nuclear transport factor 2 family protein [Flavobacterium taihuense]
MKKPFIKGLVVSSALLLLIACKKEEPVAATIDTNQIKKEIQAKENEFADTYNAGIVKNIGYHADDAITYPQNSKPIVGKTAIVTFLKTHRDSTSVGHKISFKTSEVFVSNDGAQVVELGYYKVVDSTDTTVNSGNYMSLFVKKDGKYVCLRDMSASDQPNN